MYVYVLRDLRKNTNIRDFLEKTEGIRRGGENLRVAFKEYSWKFVGDRREHGIHVRT